MLSSVTRVRNEWNSDLTGSSVSKITHLWRPMRTAEFSRAVELHVGIRRFIEIAGKSSGIWMRSSYTLHSGPVSMSTFAESRADLT